MIKRLFKFIKEAKTPLLLYLYSIVTYNLYRLIPLKYDHSNEAMKPELSYRVFFVMQSIFIFLLVLFLKKKSNNLNEKRGYELFLLGCISDTVDSFGDDSNPNASEVFILLISIIWIIFIALGLDTYIRLLFLNIKNKIKTIW